jgi:cysteine desulfurase / selenocysteine lyase
MNEIYISNEFPAATYSLYFDTARRGLLPVRVRSALAAFFEQQQGPAVDKEALGAEVDQTRAKAAVLLHCLPEEIAFTKNTSEGLNIAANAIRWERGDNVVLPRDEHPNNVYPWLNLAARGVEIRLADIDGCVATGERLFRYVDRRTRVVAVSHVSHFPGQRNDLRSIADLCDANGAYLVVDVAQSLGLLDVDPLSQGASMLAGSCHKGLMSSYGGALFFCKGDLVDKLTPVSVARSSMTTAGLIEDYLVTHPDIRLKPDAQRFEAGNFNFVAIKALGAALEVVADIGVEQIEAHVLALGQRFLDGLTGLEQVRPINKGELATRSSIMSIALPGTGWDDYFSAQGVKLTMRRGAARVSFGLYTTPKQVDDLISIIARRLTAGGG